MELNVAIRTFEFAAGKAWIGAGGGIVADSDPAGEYAECLIKATPLLTALGARLDADALPAAAGRAALLPRPAAGVFTSLLVADGAARDLAAHLARLRASVCNLYGKELPASLPADLARCLESRPSGRLRITVRPVGGPLQVTVEVVPVPRPAEPRPAGVTLRPVTVPGGIGAHKYRDRRLLAELAVQARLGPDQHLLITDETGELLETDRANVFAVTDGVLLTPPADGRLLPGITRAAALRAAQAHGIRIGQKPLTLDELTQADEVFVTNAVVGVVPVTAIDTVRRGWRPGPVTAALAAALAARPAAVPSPPPTVPTAVPGARPVRPTVPTALPGVRPARPTVPTALPGVRSARPTVPTARPGVFPARPLVVLIDNYDSFTWNLAHLLDTAGARVEVVRNDEVTASQVVEAGPAGVVISPGPCAPAEAGISIAAVAACARAGVPLLGICLGHQAIAAAFGARVVRASSPVHGKAFPVTHSGRGVLAGLPSPFQATRYHSLVIDETTLPDDLLVTARTDGIAMAIRHRTRPIEGVQFHPESVLTTHGAAIMGSFVTAAQARAAQARETGEARVDGR
jgi:para-aminobenzoate synthetase/4-amino-4-deoxychorismate lyase